MDQIDHILDSARRRNLKVVLPEGEDARILAAARRLKDEGLAVPILIGPVEGVKAAADGAGVDCRDIEIIDPARDPRLSPLPRSARASGRR